MQCCFSATLQKCLVGYGTLPNFPKVWGCLYNEFSFQVKFNHTVLASHFIKTTFYVFIVFKSARFSTQINAF